jgi:Flp pilus assembly protein TadB
VEWSVVGAILMLCGMALTGAAGAFLGVVSPVTAYAAGINTAQVPRLVQRNAARRRVARFAALFGLATLAAGSLLFHFG